MADDAEHEADSTATVLNTIPLYVQQCELFIGYPFVPEETYPIYIWPNPTL